MTGLSWIIVLKICFMLESDGPLTHCRDVAAFDSQGYAVSHISEPLCRAVVKYKGPMLVKLYESVHPLIKIESLRCQEGGGV